MNKISEYPLAEFPPDFDINKAIELFNSQGIQIVNSKPKEALKVSFDFDNTLSESAMQSLCKKYIELQADVYVVTTRSAKAINNNELFEITDRLGIKREHITFTNYQDKYLFVKDMDLHYDDSFEEVFLINEHPSKCIGFLFEDKNNNGIINY